MPETPSRLKKLVIRYPQIFASEVELESISIPEGWFELFELLCERINTILVENPGATIQVLQVKEKFGELRFYFCQTAGNQSVVDEIRESVWLAATVSKQCCQKCGDPGQLNSDGGWMRVCCERCV